METATRILMDRPDELFDPITDWCNPDQQHQINLYLQSMAENDLYKGGEILLIRFYYEDDYGSPMGEMVSVGLYSPYYQNTTLISPEIWDRLVA